MDQREEVLEVRHGERQRADHLEHLADGEHGGLLDGRGGLREALLQPLQRGHDGVEQQTATRLGEDGEEDADAS